MEFCRTIWNFLESLNSSYGNLILASIAAYASYVAISEYRVKIRPFLSCDLRGIPLGDDVGFGFIAVLKNNGNTLSCINIEEIKLTIGDEVFPTEIASPQYIPPSGELPIQVGHINKIGIEKYKANKYKRNRIELLIKAKAMSIYAKNIGSKFEAEFEIEFVGDIVTHKLMSSSVEKI
jgi:hypothetical protein